MGLITMEEDGVNMESVGDDVLLEGLLAARARLEPDSPEEWDFSEWPSCTCGHIYAATADKSRPAMEVWRETADAARETWGFVSDEPDAWDLANFAVTSPDLVDGLYEAALREVLDDATVLGVGLHARVSNLTRERAGRRRFRGQDLELRGAAASLVDDAIGRVRARLEEA